MNIIIPFTSPEATLATTGGKGTNLARLTRAGFDVPPGFMISTAAYRAFVVENGLEVVILSALENLSADDPAQLETTSAQIRAAFSAGTMPANIAQEIQAAYAELNPKSKIQNQKPVAVRSSATAEDLPDLSFAGQQDTYLNIIGEAQLFKAVVDCWSSLWTARAIGYRVRNKISHEDAALAVIVQEMVPSEVSGVLFTANPLTGLRSESVIDATFGLGEALVSGQVEPDHFVVSTSTAEHAEKNLKNSANSPAWPLPGQAAVSAVNITLGAKKISTRGKVGGGVETVAENVAAQQTLADDQIRQLVVTGQAIQQEYGAPQDIEWAFSGGKLYILQSRAITSLFPVPRISFDPLVIWFSFGAVQGLVGPLTPLGQDTICHVAAGAGSMFGARLDPAKMDLFGLAGERIWIKISDVIRHPLGSHIFGGALGFLEPSVGQILGSLAADPRLGTGQGRFKFSTARRLARFVLPVLANLVRNMLGPESARARFDALIENRLAAGRITPADDRFGRLANATAFIRSQVASALPFLLPKFIPVFGPSMAALNILKEFSPERALDVTRSLSNNVTTQMDLMLWATAQEIRADMASAALFRDFSAPELASRYLNGILPDATQTAIGRFMDRYGMRGVGEIDFGQPRWREEPTPVMHTLQSYLQIDPQFAPDVLFAKGEQAALDAIEQIAAEARKQPAGWFKEKMVRAAAKRIRLLMSARESPKFFAIRTMGVARQVLLEVGQEFVAAGAIERADDLVFLNLSELDELAREKPFTAERAENAEKNIKKSALSAVSAVEKDWKALISERHATYERELRRRQVPRVLVSDGRAFYEGVGAATDTGAVISGSPVSPGVVEGIVHVVLDPRGTQLAPGEILVCPGTDPAWTPLFMAAGGLVMEVGGMMTHGSVVAREYGLPAVVGVDQATIKLKNGQKIRVDGTTGKIAVLD
jgi:rifampicin phosphotransferase